MWHNEKPSFWGHERSAGEAKAFLKRLDAHLYQTTLPDEAPVQFLLMEQDPHASGDGDEYYYLTARKEGDFISLLPMTQLSLALMEELFSGLTVFTHVNQLPIPRRAVADLAHCRVSPHLFPVSYARFCAAHPSCEEAVFFNGRDSLFTVTNGANRALLESAYTCPEYGNTLFVVLSGVAGPVDLSAIKTYEDAELFSPECSELWISFSHDRLHIGIKWSQEAENELVEKMRHFCAARGITLDAIWMD